MSDVTRILKQIEAGDPSAATDLLPLIYDELRQLAAQRLAGERDGHTLQPTALVHEAYLRLVNEDQAQRWNSRGHFFGAAAEAMRRILVDNARRKMTLKRGGGLRRVDVDVDHFTSNDQAERILAIDEALERLAADHPHVARLVELKYFAGLTLDEAATALQISTRTAYRHWAYAKARLREEILDDGPN